MSQKDKLISFLELLLKIDKRINPDLYAQKNNSIQEGKGHGTSNSFICRRENT